MISRLPRHFALAAVALLVLGCGGQGGQSPVDAEGQVDLVSGDSGSQSYAVTFRDADGTNANVAPLDTSNPLAFSGSYLRSAYVPESISWVAVRGGQSFRLFLSKAASPVAVSDTFSLAEGSTSTVQCADDGEGPKRFFRRWRSTAGTARVVSISDSMVEVAVEGARLESAGGQSCGDGGCVDNTARGGFTVDMTLRFPRFRGSAQFSAGVDTNVDMSEFTTTQLDTIASGSRLWDHSYSTSLWNSADPYRSVTVSLKPTDRRLKPGDTYDLATADAQVECENGTRPNDPFVWTAQSGKATVVSIQGSLVTVKVENAVMKPKAGDAKGTFTINATLVTPTN